MLFRSVDEHLTSLLLNFTITYTKNGTSIPTALYSDVYIRRPVEKWQLFSNRFRPANDSNRFIRAPDESSLKKTRVATSPASAPIAEQIFKHPHCVGRPLTAKMQLGCSLAVCMRLRSRPSIPWFMITGLEASPDALFDFLEPLLG